MWAAWLILLALGVGGVGCGILPSQPTVTEPLAALVFRYLDTADADEADRLLRLVLAHPEVSVERIAHIIQTERTYQVQPVGMLRDEQIMVRDRTYPFSLSVPLTYQPSKSYGLVVCLHGAGFTGKDYLARWWPRLGDDYLLVCPTYPSGAWFTRPAEDLVLATIQHIRRYYHLDPDRIFLTGMSNGGIGTWLIGMHQAPLFAGLAPMASGLDDVVMPFLANLRNTPSYIIHGVKDQVMPVELSRSIRRELTELGYPHVYREHRREHPTAGGHYFPREELPDLVTWLNQQRRAPLPTTVTLVREASHFQPFNWVRIDSTDPIAAFSEDLIGNRDERVRRRQYAKLNATIVGPNRIEVKTELVQRYSLFLNDRLIDPSKPLSVWTNGRLSFEGPVTSSVDVLLRQARLRQDPQQLFPIHLTVTIQKQAP
jgi:pimeloyl-ACP methyl ester carboxylesterase